METQAAVDWSEVVRRDFSPAELALVNGNPEAMTLEQLDKRRQVIFESTRLLVKFTDPERSAREGVLKALLEQQARTYADKLKAKLEADKRRTAEEAMRKRLEKVPRNETVTTYGYPLGYIMTIAAEMHASNPNHPRNVEAREGKKGYSLPDTEAIQIHDPFVFSSGTFNALDAYTSRQARRAQDLNPKGTHTNTFAVQRWLAAHDGAESRDTGERGGAALLKDWETALTMEVERIEREEDEIKRRRFLTDYLPWAFEHAGAQWIDVARWADGEYADLDSLKAVREHLERVQMDEEGRSKNQPFLTLLGSNGVGKSAATVIALLEREAHTLMWAESGYRAPAVFWNAQEMATGEAFNKRAQAIVERAKTVPVLVINEFACEVMFDGGVWPTRLASVLDARYSAGRVTILTTNKDWAGVQSHYRRHGLNSIISRISGGRLLEIPGADLRVNPPKVEKRRGALGMVRKASVKPRFDDLRGDPNDAPHDVTKGVARAEWFQDSHQGPGDLDI